MEETLDGQDILDLQDLCDIRRNPKKRRQAGRLAKQNYGQFNHVIGRKMKQQSKSKLDHRPMSRNWCGIRTGSSQTAFNTLKLLTQRQQTKTILIENGKSNPLTECRAIHNRWTE